jgi:translation initiation factor 2 alpha subunit (eIF-2alpha)
MRNEAYQLGENIFALIHSSEYQRVNKNQSFKKSNRFHNQIRANSIQTIISKNLINQYQNASERFKGLRVALRERGILWAALKDVVKEDYLLKAACGDTTRGCKLCKWLGS